MPRDDTEHLPRNPRERRILEHLLELGDKPFHFEDVTPDGVRPSLTWRLLDGQVHHRSVEFLGNGFFRVISAERLAPHCREPQSVKTVTEPSVEAEAKELIEAA